MLDEGEPADSPRGMAMGGPRASMLLHDLPADREPQPGAPAPASVRSIHLREPIEAERRLLEQQVTADLTATEREHLLSALVKIHLAATDLLHGPTS